MFAKNISDIDVMPQMSIVLCSLVATKKQAFSQTVLSLHQHCVMLNLFIDLKKAVQFYFILIALVKNKTINLCGIQSLFGGFF